MSKSNQQAQPLSSRQASDQAVVMVFAIIQKAHDWLKMLELLQQTHPVNQHIIHQKWVLSANFLSLSADPCCWQVCVRK